MNSQPVEIAGVIRYLSPNPAGAAPPGDRTAVVDWNGILVVLLNTTRAFTSPEDFKQIDIDPQAHKIVVVKLGYLIQALQDISPRTIMALTPGCTNQLFEKTPYKNDRRPMYPFDQNMTWNEVD